MDGLFVVRRGHPEATTKLGTAVVNSGGSQEVSPLPLSMSHHCLLGWKPKIQVSHPGQDMNSHFKSLDCLESKAGDLCAEILNFCWDRNGGERTEMGV
uniref:Uncharacterized protein n=1 Tax=Fagus sylvatica TaxID=28930 RepID=A0A2N9J6T1_FAGSY